VRRKAWEFKSPPRHLKNKKVLAYIIGVAIGDGNLSNPNGRAVRLRITCDKKYPKLIEHIKSSLRIIFPQNKVSEVARKDSCIDISCYSNKLEDLLRWKVGSGPKEKQNISLPQWILNNKTYSIESVRGLIQTDGSIYKDRGYLMVNFTTIIERLALDYFHVLQTLGYNPQIRKVVHNNQTKYIVRLSKDVEKFIKEIKLWKE
jgi:DNA-binding transcriptional regulator WhiA